MIKLESANDECPISTIVVVDFDCPLPDETELSLPVENDGSGLTFQMVHALDGHRKIKSKSLEAINLINKQLPEMDREHISKLVFDPNHRTLILVSKNLSDRNNVIGAATIRVFPEETFSELVFFAVDTQHQAKGLGSKMMNEMKEYNNRKGILSILTYADNFAIDFFKKMGFSSQIKLPKERYVSVMDDYINATLMECQLNPLLCVVDNAYRQ